MRRPKRNLLDENSLYDYALGALSRRMHSVAELKRLMRNRCPDEAVIEAVVARLKDRKYLNDSSYAAAYSAFRRDNQKFGRRRVATDLKIKGIHSTVIEQAVAEAYAEVDEAALARAFLKRKRFKKPADRKDVARVFRALMRAGFSAVTSLQVLKAWQVNEETLQALEEGLVE